MRPRPVSPSNWLRLHGDSGRTIDTVDVPDPPEWPRTDGEAARPLTALERTLASFRETPPAEPRCGRMRVCLPVVVALCAAMLVVLALAWRLWRG